MSNRRKPRRAVPLQDAETFELPRIRVEWTDDPPATYSRQVLDWIADQQDEAGRLNVWVCQECGEGVLCVDRHPGVTPFMVSHQALGKAECSGVCQSVFYSRAGVLEHAPKYHGHTDLEPTHEWYRPSADELRRAERAVRGHVMQGGLLVREVAA